jgi:hypothetical protein
VSGPLVKLWSMAFPPSHAPSAPAGFVPPAEPAEPQVHV